MKIHQLKQDFAQTYPDDIVSGLLTAFINIRENYFLGKHEPSELNGGKFVEMCARILEHQLKGTHTSLDKSIGNRFDFLQNLSNFPTKHHDSYRLHIPRILIGIYDIRNRRGVGHVSGDVNPNRADATLIVSSANWVIAELYRLHYNVDIEDAQKTVDDIVERKLTLVHDTGHALRVLDPSMNTKDQTLVLLYSEHPDPLDDKYLFDSIEYSDFSLFKSRILKKLHEQRQIEYDAGNHECTILPPGQHYIEDNYAKWVDELT